jgi:hypothetical protein
VPLQDKKTFGLRRVTSVNRVFGTFWELFFIGLSQAESVQSVAKTLEDIRLTKEKENIPAQMFKETFLDFRKRCELLISAGDGHIESKKKVICTSQ